MSDRSHLPTCKNHLHSCLILDNVPRKISSSVPKIWSVLLPACKENTVSNRTNKHAINYLGLKLEAANCFKGFHLVSLSLLYPLS